jgi:ubiquinone/menaquinone biosynthesis C-methylase UbiE
MSVTYAVGVEMHGLEAALLRSSLWRHVAQRIVVPAALGLAPLPEEADVLQVGCGGGFETVEIARRKPNWNILGTDLDERIVELARVRTDVSSVRFEVADATALPYPSGSFDVAFSALVWHHIPDWRAATAELARVLRPGGTLVLLDVVPPRAVARPPISFAQGYWYRALLRTLSHVGFGRVLARPYGGLAYRLHARMDGRRNPRP